VSAAPDLERALERAERRSSHLGAPLARARRGLRPAVYRLVGPAEVTCRIFTGHRLRVVLPEIVGTELHRQRYIEPDLTRVMLRYLRPGMTFVDVGAHYGYHSLVASLLVQPGGTVTALEPGRASFRLLQRNLAAFGNVRADEVALSSEGGTTELQDFGPGHSALNTLRPAARVPPDERRRLRVTSYPVQCRTLDEHTARLGIVPDFVKLDAEGAELDILRGMTRVLRDCSPVLAVETGDYTGMASPDTGACIDFLERRGYLCLEYDGGLRRHRRRARYGYGNLFFAKDGDGRR
jgi:FkbM family methyltransferase